MQPQIRRATSADVPILTDLIPRSVRALSQRDYSPTQIEGAIRHIFGPDTQLIIDGTYFVAAIDGAIAGCGGWSRRRTLYGGDQRKDAEDPLLDPRTEPARIRAFFIEPAWARRGVGSFILRACMDAARDAGFRQLELVATLPGVPLYQAFGFTACERFDAPLPDGPGLPVVRMTRPLTLDESSARSFR